MRMFDLIEKKQHGYRLENDEIAYFIENYTHGNIPDYQAAALLMAIWFNSMDDEETAVLTKCMVKSGDMLDLSGLPGVTADKHSTGGVGDKTSLVTVPIAAACGLTVAKMSGRGLGHTGGTVDKLACVPGFETGLPRERFLAQARETGLAIVGQTGSLAPADKKLYALRDVTATVDCLPLIASSIMSKKLAAGAHVIVLDVKCGSGAFMKTREQAERLARVMTAIGARAGRRVGAVVTDMDTPLGNTIGNAIEVREAIETLHGRGPDDLASLSLELAAAMLFLAGRGGMEPCRALAREALESGRALEKLRCMIRAQGGDTKCTEDSRALPLSREEGTVTSPADGYITHMDAQACGTAAMLLGAGRACKEDTIDPGAGILLLRKTGDRVCKGEQVAKLYTCDAQRLPEACRRLAGAFVYGGDRPSQVPLVYTRIFPDNP